MITVPALAACLWLVPSTAGGSRNRSAASLHPDAGLIAIGNTDQHALLNRADLAANNAIATLS